MVKTALVVVRFFLFIERTATLLSSSVRLVDGRNGGMGRVEANVNGQRGTVCDDAWDDTDARVVCRQLGYNTTAAAPQTFAYFGEGGRWCIHPEQVRCRGDESSTSDCSSNFVGSHSCIHGEGAGVTRGEGNVISKLSQLEKITATGSELASGDITLIVDIVDRALDLPETMEDVAALEDTVKVFSNLVDTVQSRSEDDFAGRLLLAADKISREGQLSEGQLMLSADNLVIAAQEVSPSFTHRGKFCFSKRPIKYGFRKC